MVEAEPTPNHGFLSGGPGQSETRIKISVIGEVQRRARWADTLATLQIEDSGAIVYLVSRRIILPSDPHVQGEIWQYLPFILKVGEDKRVPKPPAPPRRFNQE